jgi:RHS repeat-associated protein
MKRSIIIKAIIILSFISLNQSLYSEDCYPWNINYDYNEFPSGGGTQYATINTAPEYDCELEMYYPSWIHVSKVSEEYYAIQCDANTGEYRSDDIWCGGTYIGVSQSALDVLHPGSIRGPSWQTEMYICYNTSLGTLIDEASAYGGGCSSYNYQWQISDNGSSFSDISGETSSEYIPGNLTTTKYFRRKVSGDCGTAYSNTVLIHVYPSLTAGDVSEYGSRYICPNTAPLGIVQGTAPSGGTGTYSYQWQSSPDNSDWSDISEAISVNYVPEVLTASTYFRRNVTSGSCGPVSSNSELITIYGNLTAGSIAGDQTLCYNGDPTNITSSSGAGGGSESYTYSWEKSTNGGSSWTSAGGSSTTFDPSNLTTTTQFHRKVTDNTCGNSTYSNTITKTINPLLTAGEIEGAQTVNFNETPSSLTNSSSPEGGGTPLYYQWQSSPDGSTNWSNINGATSSSSYSPGPMTAPTYYRRYVYDDYQGGPVYSNNINIDIRVFASPDTLMNYIYTTEPNAPVEDLAELESVDSVRSEIQYYDGLGRPVQSIQIMGSPGHNDIVTPINYDEFGREPVKYLPYSAAPGNGGAYVENAIPGQRSFFNSSNYFPGDTANAKTVFDDSPLNRIVEQGAPGKIWQPINSSDTGHTIKYLYSTNKNYEVLLWKITNDTLVNSGGDFHLDRNYYPAGTLYKTTVRNENWRLSDTLHKSEEFKDLSGNVILKRSYVKNSTSFDTLSTYYVYDDFGLLRYVLPPKAVANITSSMDTLLCSDNIIRGLCYYYRFDGRRRMITKQLPGADSISMVYDKRDRLVLTQDGNFRAGNKWLFTKYDTLNRPVLTGVLTYSSFKTQAEMQTIVNNAYSGSSPRAYYVERNSSLTDTLGFTNVSFPKYPADGTLEYLSATYYDNYDFPGIRQFDNASIISDYMDSQGNSHYFDLPGGLVTGSRVKVLETSTYLSTTNYYDDHYRVLESLKDLYDDSNGYEIISNCYSFVSQVIHSRQKQVFNSSTTRIDKYYTYDHAGRLLNTESSINGGSHQSISEMSYNELGQLSSKGLNNNGTSYLQQIDYGYNIRAWLTSINDPENLGADLFSMTLFYDNTGSISNLTRENQFNGNISGIIWNRKTDASTTLKSAYSFRYDALNRIANNYYGEGPSLTNSNKFREYDYSYDLNGNLFSLKRNDASGNLLDDLSYSYLNSNLSNQLDTVGDHSSNTNGFYERHTPGSDYSYDSNGNLTKDLNKGINTISYNFLNLPDSIRKDNTHKLIYLYDAMGTKVKEITINAGTTTGRYYFDGFEYENNKVLSLIHMDEGVIKHSSGNFTYDYFIKDHLGNTRIAITPNTNNTPTLDQSIDYYPFGMEFSTKLDISSDNKYLYNGKELQDEQIGGVNLDWYDYGARFYDPQIGRWTTPDPLSEISRRWSSYSYCYNDPIRFIDPDGMWPDFMPGDPERKKSENPFENDLDDDFFSKNDYRAPIDRFHDDPEQYEKDQWNRDRDGMQPVIQKGDKTTKDKKDKDSGKDEPPKRGFWDGFLHPNGTSSGTAPSTIVGGESLVMDAAGGIAKSEAAAASTTKAASTALSSAKIAKVFSKGVGSINVIVTVFEGFADGKGFTWGDGGKVAVAIVEVAGSWVIGVVDIATYAITGASVSERIGSGIDNIK